LKCITMLITTKIRDTMGLSRYTSGTKLLDLGTVYENKPAESTDGLSMMDIYHLEEKKVIYFMSGLHEKVT